MSFFTIFLLLVRLEDSVRDGVKNSPLDFDPFWHSDTFWKHCMAKHKSAFRHDAEQRVIGYPTLLDVGPFLFLY